MAQNGAAANKPSVLILGGVGFIGRNLVHYLVTNSLANKIRVVDKVVPPIAWLSPQHKEAFSQVEFKHANLINQKSTAMAFTTADGGSFDFVINCAAETKLGQSEAVYRDGTYKLSCNCAQQAARSNVRRYIELSCARMHSKHKTPIKEDVECEPWTQLAKHKLMVEKELKTMTDLDYVIVRPAIVYGPGDRMGLTPRLVIGGVYKFIHEKMKMLWTEDLKMNTVHVHDVVRALWHLCTHGVRGEIYNLADKNDTTQGKIGAITSEIFDINHDYMGSIVSNFAKIGQGLTEIVEEINEKHMAPWGEACQRDGINTPLNPFIDEELILNRELCVDGCKIEQTGFHYDVPTVTVEMLREVLQEFAKMGLFPTSLLQP